MPKYPVDDEVPQLRRLQEWWLELPLSYRVNALLYLLGGVALIWLLTTVLTGGDNPRQVQVGAGVASSTSSTARIAAPTAPPSLASSTTSSTGPTSTTSTTAGTGSTTTARGSVTTQPSGGGGGGGGGGSDTTAPPATEAPAPTSPPTTVPASCRNSREPACGPFSWDPEPAGNQPVNVTATVRTPNPKVGELVTFDVVAEDPDHAMTNNCSEVRMGDGYAADGPCTPPPECGPHHGQWTPPAREPGRITPAYAHTYQAPGEYTATFTFRSWSPETCLPLDPYASEGAMTLRFTVAPAA